MAVQSDKQAESLIFLLRQRGYGVVASVEQTATRRLATIRLLRAGIIVDLLFASSGIEVEIAEGAENLEILPGLTLPVARIPHLMAQKLLARDDRRRPQDLDDLRALLAGASTEDLQECRRLLALILHRGFHRDRDLISAFDELLTET